MKARINPQAVAPEAIKAMYALETYVRANVDKHLLELIKLRASIRKSLSPSETE